MRSPRACLPIASGVLWGLIAAGLAPGGGPAQPAKQVRLDANGDPLPAGALARLGTLCFSQPVSPITSLAVSPDGGVVATGQFGKAAVILFDAATGKRLRTLQFPAAPVTCLGVSANGKVVVSKVGRAQDTVCVLDGRTGKQLARWRQNDWPVSQVRFTPDGKALAFGQKGDAVRCWELLTGKVHHLRKIPEGAQKATPDAGPATHVHTAWPSPDWKSLAWVPCAETGQAGKGGQFVSRLAVYDLETGARRQPVVLFPDRVTAVAFAPKKQTLAFASPGKIWLLDLATQALRNLSTAPDPPVAELLFSPDAKVLLSRHDNRHVNLWDLGPGKRASPRSLSSTAPLAFTGDTRLVLAWENRVRLWDVQAGKEVYPFRGQRQLAGYLSFLNNGDLLTVDWLRRVCAWDARAGTLRKAVQLPEQFLGDYGLLDVSFTHLLAARYEKQGLVPIQAESKSSNGPSGLKKSEQRPGAVLICELPGQRPRHALPLKPGEKIGLGRFSEDGRTLALVGVDDRGCFFQFLDAVSGERLARVTPDVPVPKGVREDVIPGYLPVALCPAGNTLAHLGRDRKLTTLDVRTGKTLRQFDTRPDGPGEPYGGADYVSHLSFSPGGRFLLAVTKVTANDRVFRIWNANTGERVHQFPLPGPQLVGNAHAPELTAFAISPDLRLAAFGFAGDPTVRLWEVAAGEGRGEFVGHEDTVRGLAFSPDGKTLASSSHDATALVWELYPPPGGRPPLTGPQVAQKEFDSLWSRLAERDAAAAGAAVCRLVGAPEQSVAFLKKKVQPVPTLSQEQILRLVEKLSSPTYRVREQAPHDLRRLEYAARPILEQELRGAKQLEKTRRVRKLLDHLQGYFSDPERLRQVRVLEVLECIGSKEALEVVRRLAAGAPGALHTQLATDCLQRLVRKPGQPSRNGR
jgi:WD40 repeat protein